MSFLKNNERGRDNGETIVESELIIEMFDKYINSKRVYRELISMKCTQYSVVDVIREVWKEVKGGNYDSCIR
ncbi:MAG: hypothetical protein E3J83_03390 [Candidatus Atribacteria bacterium]|nr:MAG: hypothetical protein E3J83_03390 [Candidatus Atribacteria bacterium]